ncbi:MAG: 50S ribosomal protein L22 [Patescibacteria group bacterium]
MEFTAKLRHLRVSPKKIRLVIDPIRGLDVIAARNKLNFFEKRAAQPVLKLLESAIANAKNNFPHLGIKVEENNLYIKEVVANEGPTLKRWRPRAFGRATPILKRSTHINLILAERKPSQIKKTKAKKPELEPIKTVDEIKEGQDLTKKVKPVKDQEKPRTRFSKLTNFIRKTGSK